MTIVARAGGYYRAAFKVAWGVTQGDTLSPTIFNVVVDAVVRHLVTVMVEKGKSGASVDKRVGIIMPSCMWVMAWLHCRIHNVSRVNLVPWLTCSIGWACGVMSGRQLEWSAAHDRRRGPSQRWSTGDR